MSARLDQQIEQFTRTFPDVAAVTHIVRPDEPDAFRHAHSWMGEQLRTKGFDLKAIQSAWTAMHNLVTEGRPYYYAKPGRDGGIAAAVVTPVSAPFTWGNRVQDQFDNRPAQSWVMPNISTLDKLDQAYATFTFHHETGHGIEHEVRWLQAPSRVAREDNTQHHETYADMRGALGLIREEEAHVAIDTIRRLAHLRMIMAVHTSDPGHLTTRGFKAVLATVGRAPQPWQDYSLDGAIALNAECPKHVLSEREQELFKEFRSSIQTIDLTVPGKALEAISQIGAETKHEAIYEFARDYIEAVGAIVPPERVANADMLSARLKLRRNPIAHGVDAARPRIETVAKSAFEAMRVPMRHWPRDGLRFG